MLEFDTVMCHGFPSIVGVAIDLSCHKKRSTTLNSITRFEKGNRVFVPLPAYIVPGGKAMGKFKKPHQVKIVGIVGERIYIDDGTGVPYWVERSFLTELPPRKPAFKTAPRWRWH